MAVASDGPHAKNLHLAPDRQLHRHPITQFFTGWMLFLTPNGVNTLKALLNSEQVVKFFDSHCHALKAFCALNCLQCFDAVDWVAGKASGL